MNCCRKHFLLDVIKCHLNILLQFFIIVTFPNFRFATKESATHAIVATHNTEINGQTVKCSWGKEAGDPNNQQQQQVSSYFLSL